MSEIEIGKNKRARRAYAFDDVEIVPSRRTRDPEEVSVAWQIDAYRFDMPVLAAPMDSVMSPLTAIELGQPGRPRGAQPRGPLDAVRRPDGAAGGGRRAARGRRHAADAGDLHRADEGGADHRAAGAGARGRGTVAGSLSPQRTKEFVKAVVDAGVDMFVIRGTTVSAEHVSSQAEPLNLKEFIYELDVPVIVGGCATYQAALHLMRTGAAGVLVGFGGGAAHTTRTVLGVAVPMAARSPTSPPPAATTSTSPAAATSTSSRTAPSAAPATSPRPSPAVPTR